MKSLFVTVLVWFYHLVNFKFIFRTAVVSECSDALITHTMKRNLTLPDRNAYSSSSSIGISARTLTTPSLCDLAGLCKATHCCRINYLGHSRHDDFSCLSVVVQGGATAVQHFGLGGYCARFFHVPAGIHDAPLEKGK